MIDAAIAFLSQPEDPPLEVRVNFGIFAGRRATPAEIDDLARSLVPLLGNVTIVSEERHEISAGSEVSVSSVRVELGPAEDETEGLAEAVLARCEQWAHACVA